MSTRRWLLVTGKLAEPALRRAVAELKPREDLDLQLAVLPISVISLATTDWIARHLPTPIAADCILLPGLCLGDAHQIVERTGIAAEKGPEDLRDLSEYFGGELSRRQLSGAFDISILAEINHAQRLRLSDMLAMARAYQASGADVIDLGCDPDGAWAGVGDAVSALRDGGLRVSVDSFNPKEVAAAVKAGAELVLSVNSANRECARDWGCEVVAIPDSPPEIETLDQTIEHLAASGVRFRIDPVLEPIGFGFARSLGRYLDARRRYPDIEMLMGVGNLTELTEVDSAGVNVLLMGFCQEVGIRSVLTTEVINWCRSAVRELDVARRLVYDACRHHVLPKHLGSDLVLLRDPKLREHGPQALGDLAERIADRNYRLFAEQGQVIAINANGIRQSIDPVELFAELAAAEPIDGAHAFYLGYEMANAAIALRLGKNYVQDRPLQWGFLSRDLRADVALNPHADHHGSETT